MGKPGSTLVMFSVLFLVLAAVFEPEALTVHLQDMDMMGEPVEERACEAFRAEDTGPFIERQV